MRNRLNQNDVTNRVNVESADAVRDAVLELFAARYPGVPVVVVTAFGDAQSEGEAVSAGAYGFMAKPFNLDLLCLMLAAAVRRRRGSHH